MSELVLLVARFVEILSRLLTYAIIARIIISWLQVGGQGFRENRVTMFLRDVTEPVINLARMIPHRVGMIDLSPLIAILGIDLLTMLILRILSNFI